MLSSMLGTSEGNLHICPRLNISECLPCDTKELFATYIWNPLARQVYSWTRVPITASKLSCDLNQFQVLDEEYNLVFSEVVQIIKIRIDC